MEDIRVGAVEDVDGNITDIYVQPHPAGGPAGCVVLSIDLKDHVYDLDAAIELATYLGLAIARAQDPRP